ncbi:MAG: hypothetical protein US62_C0014G0016 [Candidatus Woesebacteria bacterium GW2011_GWA1_37_8]|uniref:ABC transmembrane type-1 domain-containing protein n=2 Tax=Candidatus Woeseibacteriota TaxID=1752722 RepID=A0A0G0L4W8_9BACT|nr:MAG: hypothetical protein US39_C0016G0007 [Microgenomates group bacterium GW2011_GWC1_37_12b]KKQ45512.1 MAG: hypothetical protein US62_C0014G0016 [Candidatus Woesebacteria bacterium GW2011_GWA1_37_8]KKQ87038.1 MAG: hypothetical protein UT10_C0012G0026 [Candidatus Woesebacteria bacterium GW2011_GWB1_38_8b]
MLKILKTFYRYELKKPFWFFCFLVGSIAGSVIYNLFPLYYRAMVQNIEGSRFDALFGVLMSFVGLRALLIVLDIITRLLSDYVVFDAAIDVRRSVLKHIQDLDFSFHTTKSTGSLISAMKRGDGAFFTFHDALHNGILEVFVGFITMGYFFGLVDPAIAVITFASLFVCLIITAFVIKLNINARKKYNEEEDNISGIIVDNIINFETVKMFAKESWEQNRLKLAFIPWRKALWDYGLTFRYMNASVGITIVMTVFLILYLAIKKVSLNQMNLGDFVLVLTFSNTFFPKVFDLVWRFRDLAKHFADMEKYFSILDNKIEIKDPKNPVKIKTIKGEISFINSSFAYKGNKAKVLKNIDLTIRQGQTVAFVGRSGSGKTTLIKLLLRFYDLTGGKISIDGIDIKRFTKSALRSFFGVVPQEPILFNNTIKFNIGYGKENASFDEIKAAAKIATWIILSNRCQLSTIRM